MNQHDDGDNCEAAAVLLPVVAVDDGDHVGCAAGDDGMEAVGDDTLESKEDG